MPSFLRWVDCIGGRPSEQSSGALHCSAGCNDVVILAKIPIFPNHTQNFIGQVGHGRELLPLPGPSAAAIAAPRVCTTLLFVANQGAARFRASFHREFHALRNGHGGNLLQQRFAAFIVRLGVRQRIRERLHVRIASLSNSFNWLFCSSVMEVDFRSASASSRDH